MASTSTYSPNHQTMEITMTDNTPGPEFWATPAPAIGVGGTPAQAQEMADAMIASGAMNREQADAALRAGGNEPAPVDDRSAEAKTHDAVFAAAAPDDIRVQYVGRIPDGTPTGTLATFHSAATAWASEVGFPQPITWP